MAVHHPHLLDFSNTVVAAMEPAPPSLFDHGHHQQLLALHVDGTDMLSLGAGGGVRAPHHQHHHHRVLADDDTAAAWQPQAGVSLSLYNSNSYIMAGRSSSPLFGGHHYQQQFAAVPNSNQHQLPESSTEQPFQLRNSRYLGLAQELLSEFCCLQGDFLHAITKKGGKIRDDAAETSSSSSGLWGHPSLSSMDPFELERRKARLLSMLEEVDRRYRRYREQMRAVEVSFEAVAGAGAAQVYTRLALRAMSRHFRCLRDGLVAQVRALRKAMGERDGGGASPAGATKGDTPRLKVLDQCLRQQRAFQQPGAIENYPWRPQRGLPERAVAVLRAWLFDHFLHPYPNDVDKHILARQTGLSRSQVSNWFINARVRLWKPMVEEMYTEEVKQQSENRSDGGGGSIIKPEQHNTRAIAGGESHQFRTSSSSAAGNPTAGGDHHLLIRSLHGGAAVVSLTLGLQQQPFAMPHHQRSVMLQQGEDDDEAVLPYPWS